jgi:hypothetical protein
MKLDSVPRHMLQKLLELDDCARKFTEAAVKAEREAERLRQLCNNSRAPTEEHRAANRDFPAAFEHSKRISALARAEQAALDGCKAWIDRLDHHAIFSVVTIDTSGYDLASTYTRLQEIDDRVREVTSAPTPKGREWWAEYVSRRGRAGEFAIHGERVFYPRALTANRMNLNGYAEDDPNPLLWDCALWPQETLERLLAIDEQRCSHPYPPGERPAVLARLNEEKLVLQYVASALVDAVRADPGALQVMRDMATPPAATLQVKVKLPTSEHSQAA